MEHPFDKMLNGFTKEVPATPKPKQKESFELLLSYHIQNKKPAISIGDSALIHKGEYMGLIGAPGVGKSNAIEDMVAAFIATTLNREYENPLLNIKFDAATSKSRLLVMDHERVFDDVASSVSRIYRRLGSTDSVLEGERFRNVTIRAQIELDSIQEKKDDIDRILSEAKEKGRPYDYLILDGCLELTANMNDEREAPADVRWIRGLAVKYNMAVVATLHPNKNSETAAGHFGSYLHRYARAFLLLKKVQGSNGIRMLTSDFDLGKLSHSSVPVEKYFTWDSERMFFVAMDDDQAKRRPAPPELREQIKKVFSSQMSTQIPATKLKQLMVNMFGKSEDQVKRMIALALEFEYIRKEGQTRSAVYHLVDTS